MGTQHSTPSPAPTLPPTPECRLAFAVIAAEKVFSTVELLDLILMHVAQQHRAMVRLEHRRTFHHDPLRHIFMLQRINKTFYNHIHGDTRIAWELYLAPRWSSRQRRFLLAEHSLLNKAACRVFAKTSLKPTSSVPGWKMELTMDSATKPIAESSGSWTNLLLSQPSLTEIALYVSVLRNLAHDSDTGEPMPATETEGYILRCPDGVTVGHVAATALELLEQYERGAGVREVVVTARALLNKDGSPRVVDKDYARSFTHLEVERQYRRVEFRDV